MAFETFSPPFPPAVPIPKQVTNRTLEASFGNGYRQSGPDGMNSQIFTIQLQWPALTVDEADEIEAFFAARGGYQAFLWTAPREFTPKKWVAKAWNRSYNDQEQDSITVTFEQVFDL